MCGASRSCLRQAYGGREGHGAAAPIDLDQAWSQEESIPGSLNSHLGERVRRQRRSVAGCFLSRGTPVTGPLRAFRQIRSGEDVIHLAVRLGLLVFLAYWS